MSMKDIMKKLISNKKTIGNIIIFIGLMLIAYSLYYNIQLKLSQGKKLEEYNKSVESTEEDPALDFDDSYLAEKEEEEKTNNIDKSSITDLKMVIEIPKIEVNAAVVNGTTPEYLKEGPGLYEISPLPGDENANVLIAGHRTTYGAWFRKVDKLTDGDDIIVKFQGKDYNYRVEKVFTIEKNDWSVTEPQGYSSLTLTSCHPPGSSRQRIVVRAKLVE